MDKTFMPVGIPNIQRMHVLAMKSIFDASFTPYEEAELDMGIDKWIHNPALSPYDKAELRRIVNALLAAKLKHPIFDKAKFFIKTFGFDYRKYFRAGLPYINCEPYRGEPV